VFHTVRASISNMTCHDCLIYRYLQSGVCWTLLCFAKGWECLSMLLHNSVTPAHMWSRCVSILWECRVPFGGRI
jgi:hypothetical protein